MEQTRNNITSNQGDANRRETAVKRCLGKAFGITGPFSNMAISASFFLFLGFLVFLAIWKTAGINWTRYAGAGCFLGSFAVCALAFAAQTASQIIRMAEHVRATKKGEKPRKFREGTPEFAKIIAKCFRATSYSVRSIATRVRTRNHARSHRRAARPVFARISSSPGGDGSDDSGDSDSDDPPERQDPVTPPDSSELPNKQHHPWRSHGRFRTPRRSQRGRFA
ncbi:MAG: hypothetical protein LBK91_01200 [Synergistaceae bacterium]|nr:hypothetical protein [Synergistaceae bacterium]